MASLTEIRDRVRQVLTEFGDAAGVSVYRYVPASTPVLPAVVLRPVSGELASKPAQRGMTLYTFELLVLTGGGLEVAEPALDALLAKTGDASVRAPFEADPHLGLGGGTTAWIDTLTYGIANPWAQQEADVLGASLQLLVRTTG
jgi:hypothetical protein